MLYQNTRSTSKQKYNTKCFLHENTYNQEPTSYISSFLSLLTLSIEFEVSEVFGKKLEQYSPIGEDWGVGVVAGGEVWPGVTDKGILGFGGFGWEEFELGL